MASICGDESAPSGSTRLTLKCFSESFTGIFGDPACLCDLPTNSKPDDGFGILINFMGYRRWQNFATWTMKLLTKCAVDGMIYVEGLLNLSFVYSACSLLCYGDADLHMVGIYVFLLLMRRSLTNFYSPFNCNRDINILMFENSARQFLTSHGS